MNDITWKFAASSFSLYKYFLLRSSFWHPKIQRQPWSCLPLLNFNFLETFSWHTTCVILTLYWSLLLTVSLWPSFAIVQLNVFKTIFFDYIRYFLMLFWITGLWPTSNNTILSPFCHSLAFCHHFVFILSPFCHNLRW